jgi:hypothetical protein
MLVQTMIIGPQTNIVNGERGNFWKVSELISMIVPGKIWKSEEAISCIFKVKLLQTGEQKIVSLEGKYLFHEF